MSGFPVKNSLFFWVKGALYLLHILFLIKYITILSDSVPSNKSLNMPNMNQLSYASPNQFYIIKKEKRKRMQDYQKIIISLTGKHLSIVRVRQKDYQFENWIPATPIMEYGRWTQVVVIDIVSASRRLRLHLGVVSMS